MSYSKITENIFLLTDQKKRQKCELEIVYACGGSIFEANQDRGRKHLLEHCIVSRTKDMNFRELQDFEFKNNLNFNAYTGPITMGLNVSGHKQDYKLMVDLLTEMALCPTFDQEILDQEKEIVLREISERRGEPSYRLHFDVMKKVFTDKSYENHEVLGDSQRVAETKLEDFSKLIQENLEISNLLICASGDIDTNYLKEKIQQRITNSPTYAQAIQNQKAKKPINYKVKSEFCDFNFLAIEHQLAHSHADVYMYIPTKIGWQERTSNKFFEELFLKYHGVVYDTLRNKLGLIYALYTDWVKHNQNLVINFSCEIGYIQKIIEELKKIFTDFEKLNLEQKFIDLQTIFPKKIDMTRDALGAETSFMSSNLRNYGQTDSLSEYANLVSKTSLEDVKKVFTRVQEGLKKAKIIVTSSDPKIQKVRL